MDITRVEVESHITEVTVYQGWAMITRSAAADLDAGKNLVVFTDLPESLDRDNIQVKGRGEATLGECIFETEFFVEDLHENRRSLQKTVQDLEDRLTDIRLIIKECENEKAFIDKIANAVTTPPGSGAGEGKPSGIWSGPSLDVKAWENMLAFYHNKNGEIRNRMLSAQKEARNVQLELDKVYAELSDMGDSAERSRNIITVSVAKETPGSVTLDLTYVVSGPTWRPVYSLRAVNDLETIRVEYDALVHQGTGEPWKDVALKLSTARINISGVLPVLSPWRLAFYQPPLQRSVSKSRKQAAYDDEMPLEAAAPCPVSAAAEPPFEPEMAIEDASMESGGTSVVFTVAGPGDIGGDNTGTRVSILRREFPATFHYAAVPKLSEFAYMTGNVMNDSEFPFLPGRANVFFDGAFVSVSELSLVMPGQDTDVSLGVDEGVKVEHRFLKRFKKNKGLMDKRISEQFDYQIRISNNRKKEIHMDVYDQLPMAQDKDITVKAMAPTFKEDDSGITLDDESKIHWKLSIPMGEKKELPLSFVVEYPVGSELTGL